MATTEDSTENTTESSTGHSTVSATNAEHSERKRVAVVINPSKNGAAEVRGVIDEAARQAGWSKPWYLETSVEDPGRGMAEQALEADVDLVIAVGGDGTVRAVASGLRQHAVPLGIIALGSGNVFARNLSLSTTDHAAAARVAFSGKSRTVDTLPLSLRRPDGTTESHLSLVMSGVGIDAAMIANTNPDLKKRLGWLAYIDAVIRSLPTSKPFRITYRMDEDDVHRARVSMLVVANLGELPGNFELVPDAKLDSGHLDVAVMQPKNFFGWLMVWRKITWENRVLRKSAIGREIISRTGSEKRREMLYLRGDRVSIDVHGDPQEFELDGEEFGLITGIIFETDAASLTVRVAEDSRLGRREFRPPTPR